MALLVGGCVSFKVIDWKVCLPVALFHALAVALASVPCSASLGGSRSGSLFSP